jgi:hypothetical protein
VAVKEKGGEAQLKITVIAEKDHDESEADLLPIPQSPVESPPSTGGAGGQ